MSKSKWIKSGPHKGTRGGGPAKTARGTIITAGRNAWCNYLAKTPLGIDPRSHPDWLGRPPRGMQGG